MKPHSSIVVMDYYSLWSEVYQLHRITSTDVITAMKDIFSWHGIPEDLVSDNGTQYKSHIFHKFITAWGIHHINNLKPTISTNGLVEATVKTTKAMIKKLVETKQDITEGLLIIWNTPLQCGYWETIFHVCLPIKQCYTKAWLNQRKRGTRASQVKSTFFPT